VILIDRGPLVALVDAGDPHHRRCVLALKAIREPLGTVWPVVAEAMELLRDLPLGQAAVWEMLERRSVGIVGLAADDVPRMRELMTTYRRRRMGPADAALVRVAEREGIGIVFTLDRPDFQAYRLHGRKRLRILPEA
jgi:predicted nucleic acid-binding protein